MEVRNSSHPSLERPPVGIHASPSVG